MIKRVEQLNELLKREISEFINKEMEIPREIIITVIGISVSGDLKNSKVFISVFPENLRGTAIKILNKNIPKLVGYLRYRLTLRVVPQINYIIDTREDQSDEIEKLLREIEKEK